MDSEMSYRTASEQDLYLVRYLYFHFTQYYFLKSLLGPKLQSLDRF